MMKTQSETVEKFFLADDVLFVDSGEESVMLSHATGCYFGLRGAARRVLGILQHGGTLEEMVDRIGALYEVTREDATADIRRILHELMQKGLLRSSNDVS